MALHCEVASRNYSTGVITCGSIRQLGTVHFCPAAVDWWLFCFFSNHFLILKCFPNCLVAIEVEFIEKMMLLFGAFGMCTFGDRCEH